MVYMVTIVNHDTCIHCGIYRTYEGAMKRYQEVIQELYDRYVEYNREDIDYGWADYIWAYDTTDPDVHQRRVDELRSSIDTVKIEEYELED